MEKNWLIRTKSNHILGPISKDKVIELFQNGSIKGDDEVCSGNGFWFFVREEDMVAKFLLGHELQHFNPISEAKDVLTSGPDHEPIEQKDHVTQIGGIDLSLLKASEPTPDAAPTEVVALTEATYGEAHKAPEPSPIVPETKKKSKKDLGPKAPQTKKNLKKQPYLPFAALIGIVILLLLIYYRKNIIRRFFDGEMTSLSFINSAHAQEDDSSSKKKLTERSITLEKFSFSPSISLSGFRVSSAFDPGEFSCEELESDITQLALVLYPTETFNEKLLIKLRECVLKLSENHPVKIWLKWVAKAKVLTPKEQEQEAFLNEILNSRFNLITDLKVKNKIISTLVEIPEDSLPNKILRSYLYLMIGNVTRSDNILRDIIREPPVENWKGYKNLNTLFPRVVKNNSKAIFEKFSRHPSNRQTFELFTRYLSEFHNDPALLSDISELELSSLEGKMNIKATERIAPQFVRYYRLNRRSELKQAEMLKKNKSSMEEDAYWYWYFLNINPLVSDSFLRPLKDLEAKDELWFIYLMENEKLADLYSKKGGQGFLPGRRTHLRSLLKDSNLFMLSLFKLIELGDIDKEIVKETVNFLTHD